MKKIKLFVKNIFRILRHTQRAPLYRVMQIEQDESGEHCVIIQIIGKSTTFIAKPEALLLDDAMVNLFSPTDIRNLTYLGYLGMNAPKYKILAQKLSEEQDQTLFAVLKKGEKNHRVITASELSGNAEMLSGLTQQEAHRVGFIAGIEQMILEKKEILKFNQKRAADECIDSFSSGLSRN